MIGPGLDALLASRTVGVIGSGSEGHEDRAEPLGMLLARLEVNLLTGGGQGVMASVARAYVRCGPRRGISIGVIPCSHDNARTPPPGYPNEYVQLVIATHLPDRGRKGHLTTSRNHVNVLSSDVIVALPGSHGTLSEVRLALEYEKPIIIHGDVSTTSFPDAVPRADSLDDVESFLRNALGLQA